MESLEQIMRRIHVLFARCEQYGEKTDNKIIVPKKEVFHLLEQLNLAVIAMMDQYEGTKESRERGLADYERSKEKLVEKAQENADDVYAASLIYTDNMLEEIESIVEETKENMWEQYARMAERLDAQAKLLTENQEEIKQQLNAMAQGGKYLRLIERENARIKQRQEELDSEEDYEEDLDEEEYEETVDEEDEETSESNQEQEDNGEIDWDNFVVDITEEYDDIAGEAKKPKSKPKTAKTKKSSSAPAKKRARMLPDLEAEWEAEARPVKKVGTAFYEDVGQSYDEPVRKQSYEIKINQAYFDQIGGSSADLDAEYYLWKAQQDGTSVDEAILNGENNKTKVQDQQDKRKNKKGDKKKFGKQK